LPELRVTQRALKEDFHLPDRMASLDDIADRHELLGAFRNMRSVSPVGQELTQLPVTRLPVFNLHAGRWRGLTWHDEANEVVWLLGGGYHRSGDVDDAYVYLNDLDERGRLFPVEADFEALFEDRRPAFSRVVEDTRVKSDLLLAAAEASIGVAQCAVLDGVLEVTLRLDEMVDGDFLWRRWKLRFILPPLATGALPKGEEWAVALAPAFLPGDARMADIIWSRDGGGLTAVYEDIDDLRLTEG
jgi:hypothetical protein